jgi:HrpA-like RNA helicase
MLSLVLKLLVDEGQTFKLIIMTATMEGEYVKYFSVLNDWEDPTVHSVCMGKREKHLEEMYVEEMETCPPLAGMFRDDDIQEMLEDVIQGPSPVFKEARKKLIIACICHLARPKHTVLVFLDGVNSIMELEYELSRISLDSGIILRVSKLHSMIPEEDADKVMDDVKVNECKIILSTAVAESSITFSKTYLVIDTGENK